MPNQQILQQRQLQRGATQELRAAGSVNIASFKAIDDKVGDWGDFATLSESELAALFKEMGVGDAVFDRSTIKNMMLAEMAGSGAPPEAIQQLSAQLDGMLGMLQTTIGASMASFPGDMAREFKQIYAANCCGKAQFIAALGAAETKLANAFRSDFAAGMVGLAARNGAPPAQIEGMRGALMGGTTTIIYDAGDPGVIAASAMVANGRGGSTQVATNTNPGSNNAPPLNPGGNNSNPAPPLNPTGNNTNPAPPFPGTTTSVTPTPVTPTPVTPTPVTPTPVTPTPVTPTPVTPTPVTPTPVTPTPVTPTPVTPTPVLPIPTTSVPVTPVTGTPVTPPVPPVRPIPGNPTSNPLPPTTQPPADLSNLLPPVKPEPVTLVPGGIETPPPAPLDTTGLLDLTPTPGTTPVDGNNALPDPTNTQSTDPTALDEVSSYRPPVEDPPPPCTTPACIQAELDNLAIDREVLDFERRIEPFIQTLDTLGNIGTAVGGIGCATLNPACAALPLGIAFKGLKVLIGGAKDAKVAGIRGSDQGERLGTFVASSAEGAAVEVAKEVIGGGISKVAGGVVGQEAMETFGGAVFDAGTGAVIDAGGDVLEGELKLNELPGDVARVYTGNGF